MRLQDINLLVLNTPGVYEILCTPNKKTYIGESESLFARLKKHVSSLSQKTHDCRELQNDWNTLLPDEFQFKIICFGDAYLSQDALRKKEKSVIKEKTDQSFSLYNTDKSTAFTTKYRREIKINGKNYASIAEATRDPGITISGTTIRRRLNDPEDLAYEEVRRVVNVYSVNGELFETLQAIVAAGLADNRQIAKRKIDFTKPEWQNWFFANVSTELKPASCS